MASLRGKLSRLAPPNAPPLPPLSPGVGAGEPPGTEPLPPGISALREKIAAILSREREVVAPVEPSASSLPFTRHETPSGPLYRRIMRFPLGHRVGRFSVGDARTTSASMLALLALDPSLGALDPGGFLYVDTETTGLAGGTGTVPFLVGMARFEEPTGSPEGDGRLVLEQLLLRRLGEETPILERLSAEIARASCLVSYNGKSFDLPLLRTRVVMNRVAALAEKPHLDLVHVARRVHGRRVKPCSLVKVEEDVLGYVRYDDVPGGEVVARYRHFLRTGDDSALLGVVEHNACDIVALAALVGLYGTPIQSLPAADLPDLSRTLRRARAFEDAAEASDEAVSRGGSAAALAERAAVSIARGERDSALADLSLVVQQVDDPAARLALAKLYEHHVGSHAAALCLIEQGTTEAPEASRRRRARLERKVAENTQGTLPGAAPRRRRK